MLAVDAHVLLDLRRQFTRGSQNEGAGATAMTALGVGGQLGENGEHERRRLAGAGLGDANDVVARQDGRNRRGLNGSGFGVAGFLDGFKDLAMKAKGAKWHIVE